MAVTSRERFNWEEAVVQDRELQRIDALVKLMVSKLPEQPSPRADEGRGGSRFQPAPPPAPFVKLEPLPPVNIAMSGPRSMTQFINPCDYQSESSSEVDAREVNPMDELSDFESETPHQQVTQNHSQNRNQDPDGDFDQSMDVVMEEGEEDDQNQADQIVCAICRRSERENERVLCEDCNTMFHHFCLDPPLPRVPQGSWCCPPCRAKHHAATTVDVKEEQAQTADSTENTATNSAANSETATTGQNVESGNVLPTSGPTSISIAQMLAGDPNKSNSLLIHACNCDQTECTDHEFREFCPHMKRFLRTVCWASHSDKWRSYRLAQITAELFAYHAMNCKLLQCNVPLCVKIREEEIV
ncbi:unnamed protein product [Peronospora destructor]|uniref:PHD-type domain-containing protein n=1 Tax=Peronospora destructor TaxID=86335 RepID=A0AAV0U9D3_9STRA|nr:unnamed protein product [Peronospora destructor]